MRRAELSQAAFETLVKYGIRNTTLERIARKAGVSKGVVLHHFGDKDALFEAVMRRANTVLRDGVIELFRHAKTPTERLAAVIVGNFSEPVFQREVCNAWISLCADVPYNRQNQRIQRVIDARMRSNLMSALCEVPDVPAPSDTAEHIAVLIDGLWLKAGLNSSDTIGSACVDHIYKAICAQAGLSAERRNELSAALERMTTISTIVLQSNAFLQKASGQR
ncbi:transcriptional regulator BetI [Thalassococcus sp. S3]|nr:transcriptional regulator BetI [Thalassococcus sp. S3]